MKNCALFRMRLGLRHQNQKKLKANKYMYVNRANRGKNKFFEHTESS